MYHDVMVVVLAFLTLFRWPGFLAVVGVIYHCLDARIASTNVVVDDKTDLIIHAFLLVFIA
jgi:hypothetical protein